MNRESDQIKLYLDKIKDKLNSKDVRISELEAHLEQLKKSSKVYVTKLNKLQKQLKKDKPKKVRKDVNQLDLFKDSLANKIDRSGENNGRAKLTASFVRYLRKHVLPTYKKLDGKCKVVYRKQYASLHGVTPSCIYNVLEGITWKES